MSGAVELKPSDVADLVDALETGAEHLNKVDAWSPEHLRELSQKAERYRALAARLRGVAETGRPAFVGIWAKPAPAFEEV